jgi:Tol biopolymer transport system component
VFLFKKAWRLFSSARRFAVSRRPSFRPQLEDLEGRQLLSTFYVAPTGSDANDGLSLATPFKTIQHGLNAAAMPGDTVLVRGGSYHEQLTLSHSGSPQNPITLAAYNGEHPVVTGTGVASQVLFGNSVVAVVKMVNVSYVKLIGFELAHDNGVASQTDAYGVFVQGSGSDVEIRHNTIHDITGLVIKDGQDNVGYGGAGIQVYGSSRTKPYDGVVIDHNTIYNCQPGDSETETLTVNGNITNFQITNNLIHDNNNIGIDMIGGEADVFNLNDGTLGLPVARNGVCSNNIVYKIHANYGGGYAGGIYVDGGQNITITHNISYQNDMGLEVGAENHGYVASGVVAENNLFYNNRQGGLVFGGYDWTRGRVKNCTFINNTIYNSDTSNSGQGQLQINYASNNLVANNIFVASANNVLISSPYPSSNINNTLNNNLYYASGGQANSQFSWNGVGVSNPLTFNKYKQVSGDDANSPFGDPLFVNAGGADFHLASGSHVIDAGSSKAGWFAPVDFDGVTRDAPPEIGAYEYETVGNGPGDGSQLVYKPQGLNSAQNPAFSPDGTALLFTEFDHGYNEGAAGLYETPFTSPGLPVSEVNTPGQEAVNLPGSCWNAATGRIAFAYDLVNTDEIWTMDANGGHLKQVTRHSGSTHFIEPSFSPDGQWIVFEVDTNAPDNKMLASIWKVRGDGSGLTRLVGGPGTGLDDRQPNWSPQGNLILFQGHHPGSDSWDLYTMRPDGTGLQKLTNDRASNTDASWSPDGKWIVYSSDHGGLPSANIFIISATGGSPIRVTDNATHEEGAASWSPDGKWIVFESHLSQQESSPASLWRIATPNLPASRTIAGDPSELDATLHEDSLAAIMQALSDDRSATWRAARSLSGVPSQEHILTRSDEVKRNAGVAVADRDASQDR